MAGLTGAALPPVVVLLGGPSAEHDVSIVSGTAIADALAETGADVRQVLIDLDGAWWWLPADHRRDDRPAAAYDDPTSLGAEGPVTAGAAIDRLAAMDPAPVVVIGLHGPFGEDGTIQAMLDAVGLAYTGSGVAASAVGMDKALFKRLVPGARHPGRGLARGPRVALEGRPSRRAARDGRLRGRRLRPAAHGQAGPARQLGRDDARARLG